MARLYTWHGVCDARTIRVPWRTRRCATRGVTHAAAGAARWRTTRTREEITRKWIATPLFAARPNAPRCGAQRGHTRDTVPATCIRCARSWHTRWCATRLATHATVGQGVGARARARDEIIRRRIFIPRFAARLDAPRGGARHGHTRGTVPAMCVRCARSWRTRWCATRRATHATVGAGRWARGARARGNIPRADLRPRGFATRPDAPRGGARHGHTRGTVPATYIRCTRSRRTRRRATLGTARRTVGAAGAGVGQWACRAGAATPSQLFGIIYIDDRGIWYVLRTARVLGASYATCG
jgi:hypothetical protein